MDVTREPRVEAGAGACFGGPGPSDGPQVAEEQGSTSHNGIHRAESQHSCVCEGGRPGITEVVGT